MIQYYISKIKEIIDDLVYALKPSYSSFVIDDTVTALDISYGPHPQQILDFYKGDGTTNKLLIFLHGGAWWAPHRQKDYYRSQFIEPFVTAHPDINVVSMDYRLVRVEDDNLINVYPDQIEDTHLVVQMFSNKGYEITLSGNSAGAHLAHYYYWSGLLPKVNNVISIVAPYDGTVPYGSSFYFNEGLQEYVKNQMVSPAIRTAEGITDMMGVAIYASTRTYFKPDLKDILVIWCTQDTESQLLAMQEDLPESKFVILEGGHNSWHIAHRTQSIAECYEFIMKERVIDEVEAGKYLVHTIPIESKFNALNQTNEPFIIDTKGNINEFDFESFLSNKISNLNEDFMLVEIEYRMASFDRAFTFISPKTSDGYSFIIVKNGTQRYILVYKGSPTSIFTLPKGDTAHDVDFTVVRISASEALFIADTDGYTYEAYWDNATRKELNSASRYFGNMADVEIKTIAPNLDYVFRVRGKDENGNYTEWSTLEVDGTDAFYLPLYDDETVNEYMPELEKINLTSNTFSIIVYPSFSQGLEMVGVKHNTDQFVLRETDIERIYNITPDDPKPIVNATMRLTRFNPMSTEYPNLIYQLPTEDLQERSQLELDASNGIEIPEVEIPEVIIKRESATEYLVEGVNNEIEADLIFKRLSDGLIQNVPNATLPYTFTHTAGEIWEVSGDRGNRYVSAWGINLIANAYLEASSVDDLHYNDYMEISFNLGQSSSYWQLFGKYTGDSVTPKWSMLGAGTKFGASLLNGTSTFIERELSAVVGKWDIARLITNGNNLKISNKETEIDYTTSVVMPGTSPLKFRIGRSETGSAFRGVVQYYKHGTEVFLMNEGTGTTTTGSEGTVLNLEGGATWIKI